VPLETSVLFRIGRWQSIDVSKDDSVGMVRPVPGEARNPVLVKRGRRVRAPPIEELRRYLVGHDQGPAQGVARQGRVVRAVDRRIADCLCAQAPIVPKRGDLRCPN